MLQQWPLPDTLTAARPPGGIEISGSTARIRFVDNAATVTTELSVVYQFDFT